MKSSCISHPAKEPLIIIRKWQIEFCNGDRCAAALLSFFEYWHNVKLNIVEKHRDDEDVPLYVRSTLQFHTEKQLSDGLLGLYGEVSISKSIKLLEKKQVITVSRNPRPEFRFDRTRHFTFNPDIPNEYLKLYVKKEEELRGKNTPLLGKNTPPSVIFTQTIPEITSLEITREEDVLRRTSMGLSNESRINVSTSNRNGKPILLKRIKNTPIHFSHSTNPIYRPDVMRIIERWNTSEGLVHHKTPENGDQPTETFSKATHNITDLLNGKFFTMLGMPDKERKYNFNEIIKAIDNFRLAATNPRFLPVDKRWMGKLSINGFFYNPRLAKSAFLTYLEKDPPLVDNFVPKEQEKNPYLTKNLKKFFIQKILLGQPQEFNQQEENKFIAGANLLHDSMENLKKRGNLLTSPEQFCKDVIDALVKKWGRDGVYVGHIKSKDTYNKTLPMYLTGLGRIEQEDITPKGYRTARSIENRQVG